MKLQGTFLRSKIARRIVLLFILSALVPAIALAVLSLGQVQQLLAKEGHVALARVGESYAASLLDRLLTADQQAIDIADRARSNVVSGRPRAAVAAPFQGSGGCPDRMDT